MNERKSDKHVPAPWHVAVALADIAETGAHFDLLADGDVRAAIAKVAGLRELPRLEAHFDVTRRGADGLRVTGRVSATVGQTCVVTLEPLANEIEEDIDLSFAPPRPLEPKAADAADAEERDAEPRQARAPGRISARAWNEPEPLLEGVVDLGAVAIEFLILGLDPYPRKPGAVFQPPQDVKGDEGPFAALANLTKGRQGSQ